MAALFIVLLILPVVLPEFYIYIAALILVTALLALSLNLIIGHGGMYQFHHGVFYGIGAYTFALILTKSHLPVWIGFMAGPVLAALFGLVIGWFCTRLTKLYFGMLQISLGSLIWAIVFRWYAFTGGDDGIHGIPMPSLLASLDNSYYFILSIFIIGLVVLYLVLGSSFGNTLQAIRDNPQRCEAVAINVRLHQIAAIVIGTFFAGVAGVLFVVLERSVFPDLMFWTFSLEIFIMCLLGGWFTFVGPVLGAGIIVAFRTFIGAYTDYWTLILGIILILILFFLPEGVMGYFIGKFRRQYEGKTERRSQPIDVAVTSDHQIIR